MVNESELLDLVEAVRGNQVPEGTRDELVRLLLTVRSWLGCCPAEVASAYLGLIAEYHREAGR